MSNEPGYSAIEPHLTVRGGNDAIDFYKRAFGAVEDFKQLADDGERVLHATLSLFGGQVMLCDEFPEYGTDTESPQSRGGASVTMHVNLPRPADVDRAVTKAAEEGAEITMPVEDTFWGMRYGRLRDPFGHVWSIGAPLPESQGRPTDQ
jgi:PhnB protein